jgi:hypothetical protein
MIKTLDINHQKITGTSELSVISMYQPSKYDKSFPIYKDEDMVQMMFDMVKNKELTNIQMKRDELEIV